MTFRSTWWWSRLKSERRNVQFWALRLLLPPTAVIYMITDKLNKRSSWQPERPWRKQGKQAAKNWAKKWRSDSKTTSMSPSESAPVPTFQRIKLSSSSCHGILASGISVQLEVIMSLLQVPLAFQIQQQNSEIASQHIPFLYLLLFKFSSACMQLCPVWVSTKSLYNFKLNITSPL